MPFRKCKCGAECPTQGSTRCRLCHRVEQATPHRRKMRVAYDSTRDRSLEPAHRANHPNAGIAYALGFALVQIRRELSKQSCKNRVEQQRLDQLADAKKGSWQTAFRTKIFQTGVCVNCGRLFESLFLDSSFPTNRCATCRKSHRNFRHGDYAKRCRWYDVPFEDFNIHEVFESDNWSCRNCGVSTPKEKRGNREYTAENYDTPELDHIWPLSRVVNGIKSPGHVRSNCQCLCRKCNSGKGNSLQSELKGSESRAA